jgi:hypothetical protein
VDQGTFWGSQEDRNPVIRYSRHPWTVGAISQFKMRFFSNKRILSPGHLSAQNTENIIIFDLIF